MARAPLGKHGRDHRPPGTYGPDDPGGHDPIPVVIPPGFTRRAVSLDTAYFTPGNLEAWWRLGEAGPFPTGATSTANFCADSSPHGRNLSAVNVMHSPDTVYITSGTDPLLPTMDIAGALTFGDPSINDGAIRWHNVPGGTVDHPIEVRLSSTGGSDSFSECSFGTSTDGSSKGLAVGEGFTLAAWLKFEPDVLTGSFPIISTVHKDFGINPTGWELGWNFATGKLFYHSFNSDGNEFIYNASVASAPDEWFLFVATISRDTTTQYTRRFLINTVLDSTVSDVKSVIAPSSHGQALSIGGGNSPSSDGSRSHCPGATDEVAVFSKALSDDEIANLYNVEVATGNTWTTDTVPLDGGLDTTGATADDVPIFDGTKLSWGLPKFKAYHNGA